MINLTIDGKNIQTAEGLTILQVARRHNIDIPTLCYHDALKPYGVCRLCTVEVTVGKRTRFVTACNYVITGGMNVKTASRELILDNRLLSPSTPSISFQLTYGAANIHRLFGAMGYASSFI